MHRKTIHKLAFLVMVLLMLAAIWAYVASLDETKPIDQTRASQNQQSQPGQPNANPAK